MIPKPFRLDDPKGWMGHYYGYRGEHERGRWGDWAQLQIYEQNTPQIVEKCFRAARAPHRSEMALHQRINLMRVPQARAYLVALGIVWPKVIIELGTGDDMAASTAIFLHWVQRFGGHLYSCDRQDPALGMVRYAPCLGACWTFRQCDSVEFLRSDETPNDPDMVFIDTIHTYKHTMLELETAAPMTDAILLDDAEYEGYRIGLDGSLDDLQPTDRADIEASEPGGVKRAIGEFLNARREWVRTDLGFPNVALLERL